MLSLLKIPHLAHLSSPECLSDPAGYGIDNGYGFSFSFLLKKGRGATLSNNLSHPAR